MKKRRFAIVAFLMAAVMTIGIGYAAATTYLNIGGTGTVTQENGQNAFSENVTFTEVTSFQDDPSDAHDISYTASIEDNKKSAIFGSSNFKHVGDHFEIKYTIKNANTTKAYVSFDKSVTANTLTNIFDFTYKFAGATGDGEVAENEKTGAIAADGTIDVIVTVNLKVNVTVKTDASFSIRIVATDVAPTNA